MTKVGGVVSVLVVIAIIVLAGALVHRYDHHDGKQIQVALILIVLLLTIILLPDIGWFPDYGQD